MSTREESILSTAEVVLIDIDSVEEHPENARIGDLEVIKESIVRFGQVKPIIVQQSSNFVIAGNNVRKSMKELGRDKVYAIFQDVDDETAKAYLLADNRTSDRASYNQNKLYESLEGLLDLEGTGFDHDYVETLGDALGARTVDGPEAEVSKVQQEAPAPKAETSDRPKVERVQEEPVRDIVMLMKVSEAQAFGQNVARLQKHYGKTTMKDTVVEAVEEAVRSNGLDNS